MTEVSEIAMPGGRLFVGDVLHGLAMLPDESVHCCVTSPPYWGLRDYGAEGQLGLEATPEEYVANMVAVFREVRRVLRSDGTLWLNLGDSYNAYNGNRGASTSFQSATEEALPELPSGAGLTCKALKPKDLVGIPWRTAFGLQSDGWYLRQDIIWAKPNPMPESVRDRCTKSHEYLFLLSKSPKYRFDSDAIREASVEMTRPQSEKRRQMRMNRGVAVASVLGQTSKGIDGGAAVATHVMQSNPLGRNKRSVWRVATRSYKGAHFATYPPKLIEPCILAGCPRDGVVLDPFMGSGTTAQVAYEHGRRWVGCDLNPAHASLVRRRLVKAQPQLAMEPA